MQLLRQHGLRASASDNLAAALERLTMLPHDLILSELLLPDANAEAVIHRLRLKAPGTPIIICSALTQRQAVITAMRSGAADFLAKPVRPERMTECLNKVLA